MRNASSSSTASQTKETLLDRERLFVATVHETVLLLLLLLLLMLQQLLSLLLLSSAVLLG